MTPTERIDLFNGKDLTGWSFCLRDANADPTETFTVKDGVIHCTGKPSGYMRTLAQYTDYKLHVEWRWEDKPKNSGVLVHMSEPDKVWPRSIECQLMHRNAGDFFVIDGTEFKEHKGKQGRRVPKQHETNEKELGQWNTYDIVCRGDTIRVTVNGLLQNVATECTVTSGHLCLQSEGAPIQFRNVYLEPLQ